MSKMKSFQVIALTLSMLMIISMVKGRWLDLETYSTSMITVGVHNISNENSPNLRLEISNSSMFYAEKRCESIYGFFPCADTMLESVCLMFMYMYFMILGDEWTRTGSKVLFQLIGNQAIGESVFGVLKALPRIAVFVVPGVLSSASDAQNQVVFGVSMYAGTTVITLTLIWGIHIIRRLKRISSLKSDHQQDSSSRLKLKQRSSRESDHQQDSSIKCLSLRTDTKVKIDKETGYMAGIMLLSLIPFAFVGLLHFINTPAMTLFALIVSGVSLILYWVYQFSSSWIRYRSLAYLMQENLRTRFFYHVMRLEDFEDLVDNQGEIDVIWFKRIFYEVDKNGDGRITKEELGDLIQNMFMLKNDDNISINSAKEAILIHFDGDKDHEISWDEFERGCTKWLEEIISSGSVFENIWNRTKAINKQRSNIRIIEKMMLKILEQILEKRGLVKEDGKPNREKIEGLFSQLGKASDDVIHRELKKFIETLGFGIALNDKVLDELVKDFDHDENQLVEVKKLVDEFIKWIEKAIDQKKAIEKFEEAKAKLRNKKRSIMQIILEQVLKKDVSLMKEDGKPDRDKIKGLLSQHDKDNNVEIHRDQLKKFFETLDVGIVEDHDKYLDELAKDFDHDENQLVEKKEFVDVFIKWIEKGIDQKKEIKKEIEKFEEVKEKARNRQRLNLTIIEKIMPRILEQVLEKHGLLKKDGEPDGDKIKGLFSQHDKDNNDEIHRDELKRFIEIFDFGIALDYDKVLNELVKDFDHDENQLVEKKEFVDGFIKWIEKAIDPKKAIEKFEEINWGEIQTLYLQREKPKATIVYAIFGIAIMITITSPFIASVRQFSTAAHIPFLFTSFVMSPIAMKSKMVIVRLLNAQHHVRKNASLKFSEIYDQLVMDNLIGFVSLLLVVYIRGLSWTYSAELLAIMIPCAIVGVFAIKRDTYPLWVSILAILLYPVSVYIYYVLPNAS